MSEPELSSTHLIPTDSQGTFVAASCIKTDEAVQFARPAQVASRDSLDIFDASTMLTGPESRDPILMSAPTIVPPTFPIIEDDGSSSNHKFTTPTKHPENSNTDGPLEDDSRSSFDSFKTPASRELTSSEVPAEEDSQSSFASQRSAKQRWDAVDERSAVFPAENLFEYQWPLNNKLADYYMLQEQICEFLQVKSFKRKHPELTRRPVEMDEKQFLRDRGVVTETQCDLGLTALKSEEVLELTMRDYPEKYVEYDKVLQEKEKQNISEKHKLYSTPNVEKSKMAEFVKKAIKSASEWNMNLNRERAEERRACFDLQSLIVHYPTGKRKKLDIEPVNVGQYPVSLIPGQFQDYYRKYTANELKYYPFNTVLYGPRSSYNQDTTQTTSDGSQSDSEDSSSTDGSSSDSSRDGSADSSSGESHSRLETDPSKCSYELADSKIRMNLNLRGRRLKAIQKRGRGKVKEGSCCVCRGREQNKEGVTEELLPCTECSKRGHPSCLDIARDMIPTIKSYAWQCIDCKNCTVCLDPYDEEKIMFCDKCDRAYHIFCVGLKTLPRGLWLCLTCGECRSCGAKRPGPEGNKKLQWVHEYQKGRTSSVNIYCVNCSKRRR
uniref:PHD-type domain-containing protein n=1 Tax=Strigamia maritima TaxID=126957 RepID=T1IPY3_STRMM